jgi:hypothetical protein
MADECTDLANLEQMAVCIRFVDANNIVNEEFIGFIPLDKVAAASITTALLKKMEVCKLDLRNLRGQGYDGASVMSVLKSGVSARIKELQPRAEYHHCRAHALNSSVMIENHLADLALYRMTSNTSSPEISIISFWMSGLKYFAL